MRFRKAERNGKLCAVVESDEKAITDVQSALDLLASADYDVGTNNIAISKKLITDEFFILSTKLAGEILQKFTNYRTRIAIYGDFSEYTSKALKDFIYESNKGNSVFFVLTEDEAVERLTR